MQEPYYANPRQRFPCRTLLFLGGGSVRGQTALGARGRPSRRRCVTDSGRCVESDVRSDTALRCGQRVGAELAAGLGASAGVRFGANCNDLNSIN
ncbi:hypothetical protein EVAR_62964_1 [Eumeta japonica]|uniref:Uncharacterized protein n=1 Tax=Eumeta variegata TaxID=151549 RepID=A0A4C1ZE52_EUMVA|nr:hypothetical protein EVAR_62964_1 [Eumeta japonica]